MELLEQRLNAAKERTAHPNFEQLKSKTPYEIGIRRLRREIRTKMNGQIVTRAWLKMYEILTQGKVLDSIIDEPVVTGFFNAELPGSFVSVTNHMVRSQGKDFEWIFSSLWPRGEKEDFLGDDFGLFANNRSRALMGELNTNQGVYYSDGDVTKPKMPEILAVLAKSKLKKIKLYTADGAIDVRGQEFRQEEIMIPIILGEVLTAFYCLEVGGTMVLKIFTFFTQPMQSLLTILIRSFDQLYFYKPFTSSPLNSEVYVIGIGFKGLNPEYATLIKESRLMVEPTSAEKEYLVSHLKALAERQIEAINLLMDGRGLSAEPLGYLFKDVPVLSPNHRLKLE